jgi:hypothetical protein
MTPRAFEQLARKMMEQRFRRSLAPKRVLDVPKTFDLVSEDDRIVGIHVSTADGTAEFWLEPIIALAEYHNLSPQELRRIETLVEGHVEEFKNAWRSHFLR